MARWAARKLDQATAARTTLYTSCEPCGMCAGDFPAVPTDGPHLYEEAKIPVEGYYP